MKRYGWLVSFCLLVACQQADIFPVEGDKIPIVEQANGKDEVGAVEFRWAQPVVSRVSGEDMTSEEGQVEHLLYAVFHQYRCKVLEEVDLKETGHQTGQLYAVKNIPMKWLDEHSEIFAVVNAPTSMRQKLMAGTYSIPDDDPLLDKLVKQQIDSLAHAEIYDDLISRQYGGTNLPTDSKIHHFPIDKQNFEYPRTVRLDPPYRFYTYKALLDKMADKTLPAQVQQTYQIILEDLQCRIVIYRERDVENKRNQINGDTARVAAIRRGLQQDVSFQKYMLWCRAQQEGDLNQVVSATPNRRMQSPLMAGYLALEEANASVIVVPVEHVYSRLWFQFQWNALKEADEIKVDRIVVSDVLANTQVFNLWKDRTLNNPSLPQKTSVTIGDQKEVPPFFADLNRSHYPYHDGAFPQLVLRKEQQGTYDVVCTYHYTAAGKVDESMRPHRLYVYSYQWGGTSLTDDPLITVYYHFTQSAAAPGEHPAVIYKKATARLYDETHHPGKPHHGLLRNYTYQLNCQVNTLSNVMEVQVMAVPWYKVEVDDIPPFE